MEPIKAGHKIKGKTHEEKDENTLKDFKTLLRAAWDDAMFQRKKLDATLVIATPGLTAAGSPGTTQVDTKKFFDPTKWKALVKAFNDQTVNGTPRKFPEKLLLGADEVLIRMDNESGTRMFTPVMLGEILSTRIYTSYETMNKSSRSLQKNDRDFQISVSDKRDGPLTIHGQQRQNFEPNSAMLIIDGATAAGWAKKLFCVGSETDIDTYISWFTNNVRANSDRLWQLKDLWEAVEWDIALKLRSGESFEMAMKQILTDTQFKNDILGQSPKKYDRSRSQDWKDRKKENYGHDNDDRGRNAAKPGKGKGKGKGKGAGRGKGSDKKVKSDKWSKWPKDDGNDNNSSWKNNDGWKDDGWNKKANKWDNWDNNSKGGKKGNRW